MSDLAVDVVDFEVEAEVDAESLDDLVAVVDVDPETDSAVVEAEADSAVVEAEADSAVVDSVAEFVVPDSGDAITDEEGVEGGEGEESEEKSIFLPLIAFPFEVLLEEIVEGDAVNSNELDFVLSVVEVVSFDFVDAVLDVEIEDVLAVFVCDDEAVSVLGVSVVCSFSEPDDDLLWLRRSLFSILETSDVVFVLNNKSEAVCFVVPVVDKSVKSSLFELADFFLFFLSEIEVLLVTDVGELDPWVVVDAVVDAVTDSESSLDWSENETSVDEFDPPIADADLAVEVVDNEVDVA